jgi:hypothetical protein
MSTPHARDFPAVLVTPDNYETVRTTVCRLVAQTVRDWIESVLVMPKARALRSDRPEL